MKATSGRKGEWLAPSVLSLISTVGLICLALYPQQGANPILALFPPWWTTNRIVAAALSSGGDIISVGAFPNLLVMRSTRNSFHHDLRKAGAAMILSAAALKDCTKNGSKS